jgi:hypothetical protein
MGPVGCEVSLERGEETRDFWSWLGVRFSRGKDLHEGSVLTFLSWMLLSVPGKPLLSRLVVSTPEDLSSYVVVVLGVFKQWYAIRTLVPWLWTNVLGRKSVRRTENLTLALLGARGSFRVHEVLTDGLELVVRVPTTRIGGPSPHANRLWYLCDLEGHSGGYRNLLVRYRSGRVST